VKLRRGCRRENRPLEKTGKKKKKKKKRIAAAQVRKECIYPELESTVSEKGKKYIDGNRESAGTSGVNRPERERKVHPKGHKKSTP
jgi:hypothetical protein